MIKIENVDVYGWEAAIRGMRNPLGRDFCKWIEGLPCSELITMEGLE